MKTLLKLTLSAFVSVGSLSAFADESKVVARCEEYSVLYAGDTQTEIAGQTAVQSRFLIVSPKIFFPLETVLHLDPNIGGGVMIYRGEGFASGTLKPEVTVIEYRYNQRGGVLSEITNGVIGVRRECSNVK